MKRIEVGLCGVWVFASIAVAYMIYRVSFPTLYPDRVIGLIVAEAMLWMNFAFALKRRNQ